MRILLIEDEKRLAGFIRLALREDGHAVDVAHDGSEGGYLGRSQNYDAVILDMTLPDRSGLNVLRELRSKGNETPILILSAGDSVTDRVLGFDSGADACLQKPFAIDELRARIRGLLRRGKSGSSTIVSCGDLTLDLKERSVRRGTRSIKLSHRETALLECFLRNLGRVLTRSSIAEHVWDDPFDSQSNLIDVCVGNLRRKLEEKGQPRMILTKRGIGYIMKEPGPRPGRQGSIPGAMIGQSRTQ